MTYCWAARVGCAALLLALLGVGCGEPTTGPAPSRIVDLAEPWEEMSPASQDLDEDALGVALSEAADIPRLMSLLVVRHGYLVLEQYFRENHADSLNDVRSVTKSVVSTLVGVARDNAYLRSIDQTLGELYPDAPYQDSIQREITIRHLLTMTGGFDWYEEGGIGYNDWIASGDHVRYLLELPKAYDPGVMFTYNSPLVADGVHAGIRTHQRLPPVPRVDEAKGVAHDQPPRPPSGRPSRPLRDRARIR